MKARALALFLIALCAAIPAAAQTPPPAGTPPAQAPLSAPPAALLPAAMASTLQQRAEDFLRKLYAWGPEFQVNAAAPKPSAVPDLYEIMVEVSLQGQSDSAAVYVTGDGRYMVRGEIADMNADPFAAITQKLILDGSPSKGPADAPVVIVEFGDFQCPSCRQLDVILRELLPEYPQVRLVFKDFPLEQIHPWAMTAALVGRCAYQQSSDAFWKVHDLIYDNQERITPETAYEKLLQLGVDAGLDPAALRACVANPQTAESVRKSIAEGQSLDVNSTPTSFINGRALVGPNKELLRQYLRFTLLR
jgi:protein-disulfide isomerase